MRASGWLPAVGDLVRVRTDNPCGHSRTPGYVRGRLGQVQVSLGRFANPAGLALPVAVVRLEQLFTVCFRATELWGAQGHPGDRVCVDLFGSTLEPP